MARFPSLREPCQPQKALFCNYERLTNDQLRTVRLLIPSDYQFYSILFFPVFYSRVQAGEEEEEGETVVGLESPAVRKTNSDFPTCFLEFTVCVCKYAYTLTTVQNRGQNHQRRPKPSNSKRAKSSHNTQIPFDCDT